MAIDFNKHLSAEQQEMIISRNLETLTAEALGHTVNKSIAEKIGNVEQIAIADNALAQLEIAIGEWEAAKSL